MSEHAFELLGLALGFEIDSALLQKNFIAKCAQLHPDRFVDPLDQADAAMEMALVTGAHEQLVDAESRANVLLLILGGSSKEADKSLPGDLLMDMMEVREAQERAAQTADQAELNRLHQWAQQQRAEAINRVKALFNKVEMGPVRAAGDTEVFKAIRLELNALRYYARMLEQLAKDMA